MDRAKSLGKEHYFTQNGIAYSVDVAGHVDALYPQGVDPQQAKFDGIVTALGKYGKIVESKIRAIKDPEERKKQLDFWTEQTYDQALLNYKVDSKQLSNTIHEIEKQQTKDEAKSELNMALSEGVSSSLDRWLSAAETDPNAFKDFKIALTNLSNSTAISVLAEKAGTSFGTVQNQVNAIVNNAKDLFDLQYRYTKGGKTNKELKSELDRLEMQNKLRIAQIEGNLPDAELYYTEKPSAVLGMVMSSEYAKNTNFQVRYALGVVEQGKEKTKRFIEARDSKDPDTMLSIAKSEMDSIKSHIRFEKDLKNKSLPPVDLMTLMSFVDYIDKHSIDFGQDNLPAVKYILDSHNQLLQTSPGYRAAMASGKDGVDAMIKKSGDEGGLLQDFLDITRAMQ